jgi:hypothetical protein
MKLWTGSAATLLGCCGLVVGAAPEAAQKDVTFAQQIKPILEKSCLECHGAKQAKAKLRLDTLEGALKGGEDGKVVLPGDSAQSALIRSVTGSGKKAMPPKPKAGKPYQPIPLTQEQIGLLRAWIDQGAK